MKREKSDGGRIVNKIVKLLALLSVVLISIGFVLFRNTAISMSYPEVDNPYSIISDLDHLTPDTKELALEFLERCEAEGLPVKIVETYRTQERQDRLYAQGRNEDGNVVTWTENSMHTKRRAFDIAKQGSDPYGDLEFFERCAEIGTDIGLTAGHYWRVKDSPHFQNYNWWNKFWH